MRRIIFLLFLNSFLFSCSSKDKVPSDIIQPDKMQLVVYDLLSADQFISNFAIQDTTINRDKEAMKLYRQVFLLHKVERSQFYKSYNYYMAHPNKSKALFDSLIARKTRIVPSVGPPAKKELKKG